MTKGAFITRLFGACPGALGLFMRRKFYPRLFARCGRNVIFGRHLTLRHPDRISLGENVTLSDRCAIAGGDTGGGVIDVRSGVFLGLGTTLRARAAQLLIDEGANLGSHCRITPRGPLRIGRHVLLAAYTAIPGEDGRAGNADPEHGLTSPTEIGDGCWLGVRVRVSEGVRIGPASVIGAHAAVEQDLPAYAIAVGRPARVLKMRR